MKVKIYQPTKSAMQSGRAKNKWLVEILDEKNIRHQNKLMGWTSVDNSLSQLHFEFSNKEAAIEFAKEKGYDFCVVEPEVRSIKKKSYAENFTG